MGNDAGRRSRGGVVGRRWASRCSAASRSGNKDGSPCRGSCDGVRVECAVRTRSGPGAGFIVRAGGSSLSRQSSEFFQRGCTRRAGNARVRSVYRRAYTTKEHTVSAPCQEPLLAGMVPQDAGSTQRGAVRESDRLVRSADTAFPITWAIRPTFVASCGSRSGAGDKEDRVIMPMLQHSPREGSAISKLASFTRRASQTRSTLADIVVAAAPQVMPEPQVIRNIAEVAHDWVEQHLTHAQRREVRMALRNTPSRVCALCARFHDASAGTDTMHLLEPDTGSWGGSERGEW